MKAKGIPDNPVPNNAAEMEKMWSMGRDRAARQHPALTVLARGCRGRRAESPERPPPCPRCGAPLRPDVVWFGELLPPEALAAAEHAARTCDVLLSVGTSNLVYPAAGLPWVAAARGALVVVLNTSTEGQRRGPNIRFVLGPAGRSLPAMVGAAWPDRPDPA